MQSLHWIRNFNVTQDDLDYLSGLLLENEQPLGTEALAQALIERQLQQEADLLRDKFKDSLVYNPSQSYEVGQKLIFPVFDFTSGTVVDVREGKNPAYEPFSVIEVDFEDEAQNRPDGKREFAAALQTPHILSEQGGDSANMLPGMVDTSAEEILAHHGDDIVYEVETVLSDSDMLVQVAGKWFARDLMLEVNEGHLHLAEAVLDIHNGGPMTTEEILNEIGGLGNASIGLQVFSMNYRMRDDDRFDEVGPTGEVLWYLRRLEPEAVRQTPVMLEYFPISYDASLLTPEMLALEREIDDELSENTPPDEKLDAVTVTLTYPHRRTGTLPLNARMRQIFPTAQQTPRVYVTLVDGQDGEEYHGWVVRKERYIYGLDTFFRKHRLPIGAYVTVERDEQPGRVVVNFNAYRPRTEWVRLITPRNNQIAFENHKRSIGAEYDELMILGADDLQAVDALFTTTQHQKRPLATILKQVISGLGHLTPQGTTHAKTIYSAVNAVRRCPPGPIFATLVANPDFQNVGGHYWKVSDT